MKKVCIVTLATMLVVLTAASMANAGWIDTFDTYADQAAMEAVWTRNGTAGALTLSTVKSYSPTKSAFLNGNGVNKEQMYRSTGTAEGYSTLDFSFMFYDDNTTLGRNMGSVYSYGGGSGAWGGSLTQILGIGDYNTLTTSKYVGRMLYGYTGAQYFALDGAPNRSAGWHKAAIKTNPATGNIEWYIDDVLGASMTYGVRTEMFNYVVMGMNVTSASSVYFDNVSINPVPEPGTCAAALALLAPAGMMFRRRR